MTTLGFQIKFGQTLSEDVSHISVQAELHKEKIQQHYAYLSAKINKYKLPFIVIDLPLQLKLYQLPFLQQMGEEVVEQSVEKDGRCFRMVTPKDPSVVVLLQKIEKIFQKITQLDNNLFIDLKLYDIDRFIDKIKQKQIDLLSILLENLDVSARIDLDKHFIQILGELIAKISPGFQQSPIIAFLQLFSEMQLTAEFDNPSILGKQIRQELTEPIVGFEFPDNDEKGNIITSLFNSKEPINIYIHLKKLGYLHINFEARLLAFYQCMAFQ